MCTVMLVPETLQAQMTPAAVVRNQVDELIRQEQDSILEYRREYFCLVRPRLLRQWRKGLLLCPLPFGQIMVLLCV